MLNALGLRPEENAMPTFPSLTILISLLLSLATPVLATVEYEFQEITVSLSDKGWVDCYDTHEKAEKWANIRLSNIAHDRCDALSGGWRFGQVTHGGYLGFKECRGLFAGYRANIQDATIQCKRVDKEKEQDKREARQKAEREEAERKRAEREQARRTPETPPGGWVAELKKTLRNRPQQVQRDYLHRLPTLLGECVVEKTVAACREIPPSTLYRLEGLDETARRAYLERLPGLFEACWFGMNQQACLELDQQGPALPRNAGTGIRG